MKYIQVTSQINFVEAPKPQLIKDWALIKVISSGLCGSDIHRIKAKLKSKESNTASIVLGHEILGIIDEIESKYEPEFAIGDRVAIEPLLECGKCAQCIQGNYNLCLQLGGLGKTVNGGFAEYVLAPVNKLYSLDKGIDETIGVLIDPLAVCIHALNIAGSLENLSVAIIGDGLLGYLFAELALYTNAKRVLLIGKDNLVFETSLPIQKAKFNDAFLFREHKTFDLVVEAVGGKNKNLINLCIDLIAPRGKILVMGVYPEQLQIPINARSLFMKEASLLGVNSYSKINGQKEILIAMNMLKEMQGRISYLITHQLPLKDFSTGIRYFKNKKKYHPLKIVFKP